MKIFLIILSIVLAFIGLIIILMKKDEAISKKRRESGIDKKIISEFLKKNYPNFNSNWITGWNTYVEKNGRYIRKWRYRYLVLFDNKNDYFDLVYLDFNDDKIRKLSEERIKFDDKKIILEVEKDCATIEVGDPKEKDKFAKDKKRFIIEMITMGKGQVDEGNPFALDQTKSFNDFIQFIKSKTN